ncbi:flavin reductase family protein [Methanobacterium sp. SMA-27]|uniref:flavin reductase family protein n=1 Tax=Methanobacterium sp. SMA-27 TaxID=1495336 RepID=UPI00064F0AD3|nr:flavin reductase family protein [Methanobacterium sp. SMA-27]
MKKSLGAKTIVYPTPVFIVGTYDMNEKPDVMAAAWGGISCSQPPCVSISLQKQRYTLKNIVEREAFTISIPSEEYVTESDYFGIVSGKDEDKFLESGLTHVKSKIVDAPYVKEFPLILECKLVHTVDLGMHTQFTGEIMDVKVDEKATNTNGLPDITKIKPFTFDPAGMAYYGIGNNLGPAFNIGKKIKKQ